MGWHIADNIRQTVYTIKEASARSGVGTPLIRAWERRYGVLRPGRTPSGYRLYDDDAVRVLVAMRTLTETGWTASEAARAILRARSRSTTSCRGACRLGAARRPALPRLATIGRG